MPFLEHGGAVRVAPLPVGASTGGRSSRLLVCHVTLCQPLTVRATVPASNSLIFNLLHYTPNPIGSFPPSPAQDTEVFYDLKKYLEESKTPVPPQLAHHEAAKQKPGGQQRDRVQFAKK